MEAMKLDLSKPNEAHADERLRRDVMIWLGTTRADGRPHQVPVWFLWDGDTVLIFSKPDQKIRNLAQHPAVSLALDNTQGGNDVVVLEGEATVAPTAELGALPPAYAAKYGALMADIGLVPESMAGSYSQMIRIRPTKIRAW